MLERSTTAQNCARCATPIVEGDFVSWDNIRDRWGKPLPYCMNCTPSVQDKIESLRLASQERAAIQSARSAAPSVTSQSSSRMLLIWQDNWLIGLLALSTMAVVLVGALNRLHYDYYMLVRILVFLTTGILYLYLRAETWTYFRVPLLVLTVIYNPFFPIHSSRDKWFWVNMFTVLWISLSLCAVIFDSIKRHPK